MWSSILPIWAIASTLIAAVSASPLDKRAGEVNLAIDADFPDPSFIRADDGSFYAFGTNGNGKRVQVAYSTDFKSWTLLDKEVLPTLSPWETEPDHWAPHVIRRVSEAYHCGYIY